MTVMYRGARATGDGGAKVKKRRRMAAKVTGDNSSRIATINAGLTAVTAEMLTTTRALPARGDGRYCSFVRKMGTKAAQFEAKPIAMYKWLTGK